MVELLWSKRFEGRLVAGGQGCGAVGRGVECAVGEVWAEACAGARSLSVMQDGSCPTLQFPRVAGMRAPARCWR